MELRGADFDWNNWAGLPPEQLAAQKAAAAALLQDGASKRRRKQGTKPGPFLKCLGGLRRTRTAVPGKAAEGKVGESGSHEQGNGATDATFGVSDVKLGLGETSEAMPQDAVPYQAAADTGYPPRRQGRPST